MSDETYLPEDVIGAIKLALAGAAIEALELIGQQQQKTLATLRKHGIVFESIGNDPTNWQHVAFSIYTDLCEVDSIARNALEYISECRNVVSGSNRGD